MTEFTGQQGDLSNKKVAIVVSTYHQNITGKLLTGAVETLKKNGVSDDHIVVAHVPGSWELVLGSACVLQSQKPDAIICLGCVIRGETTHDQHINTSVSNELNRLSADNLIPLGFGLLTCNTLEQAIARSGGDVGNKGEECAHAVINMLRLQQELIS